MVLLQCYVICLPSDCLKKYMIHQNTFQVFKLSRTPVMSSYSGPSDGVGRRPVRTVRQLSRDNSRNISQTQPPRGVTPPIRQQAGFSSTSGYSGGGRSAQQFDDDDWLARSQKSLRQRQVSAQSERSRGGSSQSNFKRDSPKNVKRFSDSSSLPTIGMSINQLTRNLSNASDTKKDSARLSAQHSARSVRSNVSNIDMSRIDADAETYLTAIPSDGGLSPAQTPHQTQEMNWAELSAKFQLALEAGELEDRDKTDGEDTKPTSAAAIEALKRAEMLVEASRQRADGQRQVLQAWIDKLRPEAKTEIDTIVTEEQHQRLLKEVEEEERRNAQQEPSGGTDASAGQPEKAFVTAADEEEEDLVDFPHEFDDAVGLAVEVVSSASKTGAPKDTSFVPAFLQKYFDPAIAVKAIPHLKEEAKAITDGDSDVPKSYLAPEVRKGLEQIKRLDQILASREKSAAKKRAALERCRQRFEAQRQAEINILEEKKRNDVEEKRKEGKIEKVRRPLGERLSSCGSSVALSQQDDAASSVAAPPSETASTKKTSKDITRGSDGLPNFMRPRGRDKKRADYSAFGGESLMNPGLTGVGEQVANSMSYDLQLLDESDPDSGIDELEKDNEDLLDVFVTAMDGAKQQVRQEYEAEAAAVAAAQGIPDHLDPAKVDDLDSSRVSKASPKKVHLFRSATLFNVQSSIVFHFIHGFVSNSLNRRQWKDKWDGKRGRVPPRPMPSQTWPRRVRPPRRSACTISFWTYKVVEKCPQSYVLAV